MKNQNGKELVMERIEKEIEKAFLAVYPMNRKSLTFKAQMLATKADKALNGDTSEEAIGAVIEAVLSEADTKVYREYIVKSTMQSVKEKDEKQFSEYLNKNDWRVNENANMGFSLQGLNQHIVSEITESYWLNHVYTHDVRQAHQSGDIHLHDLGLFAPYCCGWSLENVLEDGFCGVPGKVESAPPKHFKTALGQITNFLYTLQGEAAGAQAFSNFDTYLAPFIRVDGLTFKEVKQAMQEFIFNCNIPTRVGFQTPFINLTMDVTVPRLLKNLPIIIGGVRDFAKTYGDYQHEMNLLNQAFAEVMMEGDSKGRQFSFPIPTYNLTKDFDWDNPVLDTVFEMTAKYGIPAFCNYINSEISPEDATSMCCRLRLDRRELVKRGGGQFGSAPLTGSIGVVTINMARLGYLAKDEADFFKRLRILMDISKESLILKRVLLEENTEMGLYPYSKFYLRKTKAGHGSYWKNHFNTIGLNGMNECLMNFFGKEVDMTTEEGTAFAIKVLEFMNQVIVEYQDDNAELMYNLEATPAEGTGYKLALKDRAMFPDIITQGEDEPYYTNSTQLPVGFSEDLFEALDLQDNVQTKYTGGTTFHAHLGEKIDTQLCKDLVKKIASNYKLPYFTISPVYSVCNDHGYISGEHFNCPTCKKETEVWARVVGFNRPVKQWNKGKKAEFADRLHFSVS